MPERSRPVTPPAPPLPRPAPLTGRETWLRAVLPPLFVLVVFVVEILISRIGSLSTEFWAHLLFYGLVGPSVTYFTLSWIAEGTRAREQAEQELRELYAQLRQSHGQLQAVQELMRDLTEARDLGEVMDTAARGRCALREPSGPC
ncbi:hypothetical protein ACFP81_09360 [Deinococcus lacus]|uniref:Uncharacterized protein n=1 Tax=Deinococcus lacus TaxID=392561 RepID=A0ABW1YD07_9DEIO